MPIYEFLCESCGKVNERLQKLNDPPPARCDECGSSRLAKLVSRSAFQLKGGGWYSDLYASRKPEKPDGTAEGTAKEAPAKEAPANQAPAEAAKADPAPAKADKKEPAAPSSGKKATRKAGKRR